MEKSEARLINVSDLRQWVFCRRIIYWRYVVPVPVVETYFMQRGRHSEDADARRERRRLLGRYGLDSGRRLWHPKLVSESLGLVGIPDLVVINSDTVIPVDFKMASALAPNIAIQLAAYGMLCEEVYGKPCRNTFVCLRPSAAGGKPQLTRMPLDDEVRQMVRDVIEDIRLIISAEALPPPTDERAKCMQCEFRNYCNDIF